MVRSTSDPAKKETLRRVGGKLVEGDLKDRASLDRACAGTAAVITTPTAILSQQQGDTFASVDLRGQMQLIDAAGAAKVGHFVSFRSQATC
jgi:nucleoside-diphosphate-sugar epimerase